MRVLNLICQRLVCSALLCLALAAGAQPALAAAGAWVRDGEVSARLISAVDASGTLATLPLGLQVRMQPGWKTYWRSPGEAGLAPRLDWQGSDNLRSATINYPVPQRFSLLGLETFGYEGEVVFPLAGRVKMPGAPLALRASADLLVCAALCVPHTLKLALDIPVGEAIPGAQAQIINRFLTLVPNGSQAGGLAIARARLLGAGREAVLEVDATSKVPFRAPDVFPESETLAFGHPQVLLSNGGLNAQLRLPILHVLPGQGLSTAVPLQLTLVDGQRSLEANPKLEAAALPGLWERLLALAPVIALALLGGLILNLMPCVLPVLSMKVLAVISQGGQARSVVRAGFLATAAGILTSFMLLAGALVILKASGQTIGWGIQFQQPVFVVAMVVALTLFASNLWGLFEITLPGMINQQLGQAGKTSLAGHFAAGAFATLLATPCSAPFLGTAVGFALASGPMEIFAIFLALGAGLALPFLLVATWPQLATRLPRPGAWMVQLRGLLGFAIAATAIWLLYVIHVQIGTWRAALVALAMGVLVAALATLRHHKRARLGAMVACAVAALVAATVGPVTALANADGAHIGWRSFDPVAIKSLVAQGRTVFVDVTADWCLTCQANQRLVLEQPLVGGFLNQDGVTDMKADWTKPDADIARFLAAHGRYGIPFNMVFGPGAPSGIALPELLTNDAVIEALAKAQRAG